MENVREHLSILGLQVRDRVSALEGVVTSVKFALYGCVQALVYSTVTLRGIRGEQDGSPCWFDIARLAPVMTQPDFTSGPVAEGLKAMGLQFAPNARLKDAHDNDIVVRATINSGGSMEECVVNLVARVKELQRPGREACPPQVVIGASP